MKIPIGLGRSTSPRFTLSDVPLIFVLLSFVGLAFPELMVGPLPFPVFCISSATVLQAILGMRTSTFSVKFLIATTVYLATVLIPGFFVDNLGYFSSYYYLIVIALIACMLMQAMVRQVGPRVRYLVLLTIVIAGVILAGRALYDLMNRSDLIWILQTRQVGVASMVSNNLAAALAASSVCTVGVFYHTQRNRFAATLVGISLGVLQLLALLATGSRGGVIAFIAGSLALAWFTKARVLLLGWLAVVAVGLVGGSILVPEVVSVFLGRMVQGSLSGRSELWGNALEVIFDHPLFGVGMGNFRVQFAGQESFWTAHNIFLQQLLNGGILALAAYLWLWGTVLSDATKSLRAAASCSLEKGHISTLLAALVALWSHSMVEPALGSPVIDIMAWSIAGLTAYSARTKSQEQVSSCEA